MTLLDDEQKLE